MSSAAEIGQLRPADLPLASGRVEPELAADAVQLLGLRLVDGTQLVADSQVRRIVSQLPGMIEATSDPAEKAKLLGVWLRIAESGERRKGAVTPKERIRRELLGLLAELGRRAREAADR